MLKVRELKPRVARASRLAASDQSLKDIVKGETTPCWGMWGRDVCSPAALTRATTHIINSEPSFLLYSAWHPVAALCCEQAERMYHQSLPGRE